MNSEKLLKIVLVVVETLWVMMLACACVAFIQVISAHADEPKVIMGGQYVELHPQMGAIDIEEAPPINRVSEALDEVDANGRKMEYIGDFYLTYYCKCGKCNGYDKYGNPRSYDRDGNPLVCGTVAVDPRVIPLQTHLVIDGYDMEFVARDTGGKWVQGKHIDIYVPVSHSDALQMCKGEKRKVWKYCE